MKENERRNEHPTIYMGAATGWERTNIYTVWLESIALQEELEKRLVDCRGVGPIVASDFLKLANDCIGQNMTSSDVLDLQLDFVTAQVIDLAEIWRRNEIRLGPCSALPFYRGPSAPRSVLESLTTKHDWRKRLNANRIGTGSQEFKYISRSMIYVVGESSRSGKLTAARAELEKQLSRVRPPCSWTILKIFKTYGQLRKMSLGKASSFNNTVVGGNSFGLMVHNTKRGTEIQRLFHRNFRIEEYHREEAAQDHVFHQSCVVGAVHSPKGV